MTIQLSRAFLRMYKKLPQHIQRKANKQLDFLAQDLRHPSVQARKMNYSEDVWEARVNGSYRMTFNVKGSTIQLRKIGTHEIYRNP